jgi:hypothetical protein
MPFEVLASVQNYDWGMVPNLYVANDGGKIGKNSAAARCASVNPEFSLDSSKPYAEVFSLLTLINSSFGWVLTLPLLLL